MWSIAPDPAGPALRAEALARCDQARGRIEHAIAVLSAIDAECRWRSRAVDAFREQLRCRTQELREQLHRLDESAASLRAG